MHHGGDMAEQVARRGIDPMGVLDQQQHRSPSRKLAQHLRQHRQHPLFAHHGIEVGELGRHVGRDRQEAGEQRQHPGIAPAGTQQHTQLAQFRRRFVCRQNSRRTLEHPEHRIERAVGVVRRALAKHTNVQFTGDPGAQRLGQARFADARLAGEQHQLALAAAGELPTPHEQGKLQLAADQVGQRRVVRGGEAAFHHRLTHHLPACYQIRKTLEGNGVEWTQLEHPAKAAARAGADNGGVGFGDLLQARREVRRLAHHQRLRRADADHVADDDQPGGDADADLDWRGGPRQGRRQVAQDGQGGMNRALGIVLMRLGPAEAGEHAVAMVGTDMAAERLDRDAADLVVVAGDDAEVLRVEPRGELGRPHHVTEYRRDLAPLGARIAGGPRQWRAGSGRALGNRSHQPLARAERHTPTFEVEFGELAQRLVVDLLRGEEVAETAQPDGLQPFADRTDGRCFDRTCVGRHRQP